MHLPAVLATCLASTLRRNLCGSLPWRWWRHRRSLSRWRRSGGVEGFLELFLNLTALVCLIFGHTGLLSAASNQRFDILLADTTAGAGSGDAAEVDSVFLGHAANQRRTVNAAAAVSRAGRGSSSGSGRTG